MNSGRPLNPARRSADSCNKTHHMNPVKSGIIAFLVSMAGFLAYYLLANSNGSPDIWAGLQNLGYLAAPISAIIAGVVFVLGCIYKVAARDQ